MPMLQNQGSSLHQRPHSGWLPVFVSHDGSITFLSNHITQLFLIYL
ncbi:hypothetical protein [Neobacillus mesonae]|nr:hypothetical protein [Neobacillus mesonae]MCM3568630.1 hypothetical protein [Neobacillus mesonae]